MTDPSPPGEPVQTARELSRETLFQSLYVELRRLARRELGRSGAVTLGATDLLHEAFLDMSKRDGTAFPDRARFMAYAARAMRGLVIDYALADLVDLKFFCGLSTAEIAALRGVSDRTVERDWTKARVYLRGVLADEPHGG